MACAKSLADAEQVAIEEEWTYGWDYDQYPDLSWMTDEERRGHHEVLVCVLRDSGGDVLASLGGIVDPDTNYMRVIQAELAAEAIAEALAHARAILATGERVERIGR